MDKLKRYIIFLIGLFINSLGVSLITKAALGTSPISSIPYVLSLIFPFTLGQFTIYFSVLLVVLQLLILRRKFKVEHLLQIPISIAFGYFIDLTMEMLSFVNPQLYIIKIAALLIGCAILGFGVYTELLANVAMLPGESFVRAAFASADISDSNYAQNEFQGAQKLGSTPLRGSKGKLMLPHNVLAIRLQFNPIAFGSQYLVMRLLYADENPDGSGDLQALGFGEYEENLFYRLRAVPTGLSVIAGPTGSGKSTTLQRNMIKLLQEKNYEINLITVEDPPEYPIPGARQMPVTNANTEEEKTVQFTLALSAALRSDPDVLMVGEIRSLATASLTFKGALSGHLVWATLHANSAPAIVTRLRDMGVQSYMLSDPELLKGLISQRLFRKLCPYCRVPVKERLDNPAVKRLRTALGDFGVENTYLKGPGCKFCEGRGIKGRLGVQEMILPDGTFLELMIAGETRKAIDYWTGDLNGRTLKDAALERMLKGLIDLDEVERWCGLLDQRPVY